MGHLSVVSSSSDDRLLFYYGSDALKNEVILRTTYRAKTIRSEAGKSQLDDYAMSEQESDAFLLFLDRAVRNVFVELIKLTSTVKNSVFVNEDKGGSIGVSSGWYLNDYGAGNDNTIDMIDIFSREALIFFIMKEWYAMMGITTEYERLYIEYNKKIIELSNQTLELRKKSLT